MTPAAPQRSVGRRIVAELPRPRDVARFCAQLLQPTRGSAWRGAFDGLRVAYVLKRKGIRSLVPTQTRSEGTADVERAVRVGVAVDAGLALLPVTPTCLRRSVTLLRELERLDLAAELHIGVRTMLNRDIQAHAWLQVGNSVINDDPAVTSTYVELAAGKLEQIMPALR